MITLRGKRVLLVEDEALIAFAVEDILTDLGCATVGPAFSLDEACKLAETEEIDAAILDVNLNDQRSYPVALKLRQRGVPFVFASGYDPATIEWDGEAGVLLAKPYRPDQIRAALERMLG